MPSLTQPVETEQPTRLAVPGRSGSWVSYMAKELSAGSAGSDKLRTPCPRCGHAHLHLRRSKSFADACLCQVRTKCSRCMYEERHFRLTAVFFAECIFLIVTVAAAVWFTRHPISLHGGAGKPDDSAAAVLAGGRMAAGGGKLSTFEQMMLRKPRGTLDNATILKLCRANVDTDLILQLIKTTTSDYDVSASAIIELKEANVNRLIIMAMINANYGTPSTP